VDICRSKGGIKTWIRHRRNKHQRYRHCRRG
jgi:ribosomal protein RSM22 (predicted rRNA methylase)